MNGQKKAALSAMAPKSPETERTAINAADTRTVFSKVLTFGFWALIAAIVFMIINNYYLHLPISAI